jgi:Glycosyl transferase family 2
MDSAPEKPGIGTVIRFKDSSRTLPSVLAALAQQSLQPSEVVGVDTGSRDGSADLMRAAGARVIVWNKSYHHSKVLNFAARECPWERILVLSSHTVLNAPNAVRILSDATAPVDVACASAVWDDDATLPDELTLETLRRTGTKFGSIYSNSMGMFRRRFWRETPFDENIVSMEDYAWALEQLSRGRIVRRVRFDFSYQRSGGGRNFTFAAIAFRLAAKHGLQVRWLGPRATLGRIAALTFGSDGLGPSDRSKEKALHLARFKAWLLWRWINPESEI